MEPPFELVLHEFVQDAIGTFKIIANWLVDESGGFIGMIDFENMLRTRSINREKDANRNVLYQDGDWRYLLGNSK